MKLELIIKKLNMKKGLIIGFVLAAVLVLSGCPKPPQQDQATAPGGAQQEVSGDENSFTGSLKDLLALGKSLMCTVTFKDESGEGKSVSYVSGEKMRSDVEMKDAGGKQFSSHTIIDGQWMYIWDDTKKGTKMKLEEPEKTAKEDVPDMPDIPGQEQQESTKTDLNEEYDYKCVPWVPNNSKFTPPTDVEFTDLTQAMQQFQQQSEQAGQDACAICDSIPDATAQAECKKSCQ